MSKTLRILLLEDDSGDARMVEKCLQEDPHENYQIMKADRLQSGLEILKTDPVDAILLDFHLPDAEGYDLFEKIHARAPSIPVIILTARSNDSATISRIIRSGAEDHLDKNQIDSSILSRAIRHSMDRKFAERELNRLKDDFISTVSHELHGGFLEVESGENKVVKFSFKLPLSEEEKVQVSSPASAATDMR